MWSLGCLLFAWHYGYSPFECEFADPKSKTDRTVECTHLRVLSKIPVPAMADDHDVLVNNVCTWVLRQNISDRPYLNDLVQAVNDVLTTKTAHQVSSV